MFFRYIIYPLLFSVLMPAVVYDSYMGSAIQLFLIEEVISILAINYYLGKYSIVSDNQALKAGATNYGMIILFVLLAIIVLVVFPTVRYNYQFVFETSIDTMEGMDFGSITESLGYVVVDIARLLSPLIIINICYNKSLRSKKVRFFILLSFLACIIPMLIIKQMNRGSSFFTSLIYLWIVIRLYGWGKSRSYVLVSMSLIVGLLAVVSSVKHNSELESHGVDLEYAYDVSQSYSLGITQIRNGLITNHNNRNTSKMEVAFNDVICSFPILNQLGNPTKRYTYLYNEVVYEGMKYNTGAALAPLLTNMIFLFGPFGFVIPILFLKYALKVYFKCFKEKSVNTRFLYVYLSLVLVSGSIGSIAATIATLVWMVLPMFIVVKISNR